MESKLESIIVTIKFKLLSPCIYSIFDLFVFKLFKSILLPDN